MLGVLNFGWLAFLYQRVFSAQARAPLFYSLQRLFLLTVVSLLIWCLLIYIPGSNVIHAGSYATVLLLYPALGISLATVTPGLAHILLAFQALFLFPLFAMTDVFMKAHRNAVLAGGADLGMAFLAVLSLIGLLLLLAVDAGFHPRQWLKASRVNCARAVQ